MTEAVLPSVPGSFEPFHLRRPTAKAIPLVCDSPHSGILYPDDFGYALPFQTLRKGEDTDVHVLWEALPSVGATLLAANFPRSYVDPNREVEDIDASMLDSAWPLPLAPSEKTRLGIGLIWRDACKNGHDLIYQRKLSVAEVQNRINRYYKPYHAAMQAEIEAVYARFGAVWHLNLHSMPSDAYEGLQIQSAHRLADVVLGDRDGTTAAPEFTALVANAFRQRGFSVAINDPYKGVALIGRLGRPAEHRHSLQIELHRGLYMNEDTRARGEDFIALKNALTGISAVVAAYVQTKIKT